MPNEDKIRLLYNAVSKDYDIGTEEDFRTKLSDPNKRKAFYDGVGAEYQLGTFDEFNTKIDGSLKKKEQSGLSPLQKVFGENWQPPTPPSAQPKSVEEVTAQEAFLPGGVAPADIQPVQPFTPNLEGAKNIALKDKLNQYVDTKFQEVAVNEPKLTREQFLEREKKKVSAVPKDATSTQRLIITQANLSEPETSNYKEELPILEKFDVASLTPESTRKLLEFFKTDPVAKTDILRESGDKKLTGAEQQKYFNIAISRESQDIISSIEADKNDPAFMEKVRVFGDEYGKLNQAIMALKIKYPGYQEVLQQGNPELVQQITATPEFQKAIQLQQGIESLAQYDPEYQRVQDYFNKEQQLAPLYEMVKDFEASNNDIKSERQKALDKQQVDEAIMRIPGNPNGTMVGKAANVFLNSANDLSKDLLAAIPEFYKSISEGILGAEGSRNDAFWRGADKISDLLNSIDTRPLPEPVMKDVYKDGKINWEQLLYTTADQAPLFLSIAAGNAATAPRLQAALGSKKAADFIGTVGSTYATAVNDYGQLADQYGLTGRARSGFVNSMALAEGAWESILPNNKVFTRSIRQNMLKNYLADLAVGGEKTAVKNSIKNLGQYFIQTVGDGLKEGLEEIGMNYTQPFINQLTNKMNGGLPLPEDMPTLNENLNAFIPAMFTGAIPSGVSSARDLTLKDSEIIQGAIKDMGATLELIDKSGFSQEHKAKLVDILQQYQTLGNQLPQGTSDIKKAYIIPKVDQIKGLKEQAENPDIDPSIKAGIESKAGKLQKEVNDAIEADDKIFAGIYEKEISPLIKENYAQDVREDEGQVQEGGTTLESSKDKGGEDLQRQETGKTVTTKVESQTQEKVDETTEIQAEAPVETTVPAAQVDEVSRGNQGETIKPVTNEIIKGTETPKNNEAVVASDEITQPEAEVGSDMVSPEFEARVQELVDNSLKDYNEAATEKQVELYEKVRSQLEKNDRVEKVGVPLDAEMVEAGKRFLKEIGKPYVNPKELETLNKEAESFSYKNIYEATNSVNKRLGTDYKDYRDIPKEQLQQAGEQRQAEIKEAAKKLADKIRAGKIGKDKTLSGIFPQVWDAALEVVATTVEAGGTVAQAIADGLKYIKESDWYKGLSKDEQAQSEQDYNRDINSLVSEEPTAAPTTPEPVEKPEPPQEERRFAQQVIKSKDVPQRVKDAMTEDTIYYARLPNDVTLAESNAVIDQLGEYAAADAVMDFSNKMSYPVRFTVGQVLIKRLSGKGEYELVDKVIETVVKEATELGQGIQALSMFAGLTPQGQLQKAKREINKQREKKFDRDKKKTTRISKAMQKANEQAADEAIEKVKQKIEGVSKIEPKAVVEKPRFAAKNKVFTKAKKDAALKALKGKLFSSPLPPELIDVAGYYVEGGLREFAAFSEQMVKAVGKKVRPHLKEAYNTVKKQLVDAGYDEKEFTPAEQVDKESFELNYPEKQVGRMVKEGIKSLDQSIQDIIRAHYTVYDEAKRSLSDKLVEEAGLTGNEAKMLSDAVQKEFDRIAKEKKTAALQRLYSNKERKKPQIKSLEEKLIDFTNLGGFTEGQVLDIFAEKMGYPKLSEQDIKEITRLAEAVQSQPEGLRKQKAIEDLLAYQANIKGTSWWDVTMSIWYANILSGYKTQEVNFFANLINSALLYTNAAIQNPKQAPRYAQAYLNGVMRGVFEGVSVLQTGYTPIKGKAEVLPTLERVDFWGGKVNPANYLKYVRRFMMATDVLFFEGLKEMRAYQLAQKMAAQENLIDPTVNIRDKAVQLMGVNKQVIEDAQNQAELEYQQDLKEISESGATGFAKRTKEIQALTNRKRRAYELVEQKRNPTIIEQSNTFGAKGTFNYRPEGVIGAFARVINRFGEIVPPFRFIVPFTNIIANTFNEALNYTPIGTLRALNGGTLGRTKLGDHPLTEQEKIDLHVKALMGLAAATAIYLLTQPGDEDEEPVLQITANGTGDFKKNNELKNTGWNPYSVKIGDQWVSYRETPMLGLFSFIGNVRDYEKYRNAKITDNEWTKWGTSFGLTSTALLDGTYLKGLNEFLGSALDPRNTDKTKAVVSGFERNLKNLVIPNLFTQAYKDYQAFTNESMKETGDQLGVPGLGTNLRDIPFLNGIFYDKIDGLGDPVIVDSDRLFSTVTKKGVDKELWEFIAEKKAFIGVPYKNTMTVYDPASEKDRIMTDKEYYEFLIARGSYIKSTLLSEYSSEDTDYSRYMDYLKTLPDEEVQKAMTTLKRQASEHARTQQGLLTKSQFLEQ